MLRKFKVAAVSFEAWHAGAACDLSKASNSWHAGLQLGHESAVLLKALKSREFLVPLIVYMCLRAFPLAYDGHTSSSVPGTCDAEGARAGGGSVGWPRPRPQLSISLPLSARRRDPPAHPPPAGR